MKKTAHSLFFLLVFFVVAVVLPANIFACSAGQIDLLEYMGPDSIKNYDLRYCGPNGGGSEPITVKRDTVITTDGPKTGFFLNKGSNYEAYFYTDSDIYFYEDTSWDETCPGGQEAFYRVFTPPGMSAGGKIPRCVNLGDSFSSPQQIKAYSEAGYTHGNPGNLCDDSYGPTTISAKIESASGNPNAPDVPGAAPDDTIVITNLSGAGAGEEKFYTKGYGLTAFRATDGTGKVIFQSSFYLDGVSTSEPNLACSSESGYNLSKYPLYDVDPTWYYIQPLAGVGDPLKSPEEQLKTIRNDLAGQGYEAHCAAQKMTIKPEYDSEGLIDKYFSLYPDGVKILETESSMSLNYQSSGYPLFRDTDGIRFLTTSIEEYFGFRDIYEENSSLTEINSAATESLLSESQKCKGALKNLRAMYWMCTLKQLNPADCALYAQKVPGTGQNVNQFQIKYDEVVKDLESRKNRSSLHYLDGGITRFCDALIEDTVDQTVPTREELVDFKKDLLNFPLYQDRTYRLAFVVAAIEQKNALGNIPPIFNFFAGNNTAATPKHEVLIAAFKIPDIATNKGGLESGGGIDFDDPLIYTRNSLLQRKDSEEIKAQGEAERGIRQTRASQNRSSPIDCYNYGETILPDGTKQTVIFPNGDGSATCKTPLGKAVVDIINADEPSCEGDILVEDSQIIGEITGVVPPPANSPSRVYQPDYGNILLEQMFLNDITHPGNAPEIARRDDLKSIFHLTKGNWAARGGETTANFYIVYPFGYDYDTVVDILSTTFFASDQTESILADPASENERFPIHNDGLQYRDGSDSFTFSERGSGCHVETDPVTGLPITVCPENTVTIKVTTDDTPSVSVLGAQLGFWMRKIQQAFNPLFSEAHNYITSCRTTEEFLLGRCLVSGSAINNRYSCLELATKQIPVPNYQEVAEKVCQAANANRPPEIPAKTWQQLVWGILQIEGSPFLRAVRSGQSTTTCGPISDCGAVGPMQIINGQCATDACPNPGAKNLIRSGDFCSLEGSLQWAVGYLRGNIALAKAANPAASGNADALAHTLAGKYHGLPDSQLKSVPGEHCYGAPPVQGCGNLNYCECAMQIQASLLRSLNAPSCN